LLSFPASWLSSPLTAETLVCWFMFDIDLHPLLPRGHEITWDVMVGLWAIHVAMEVSEYAYKPCCSSNLS
jgi:hypothetical protein